MLGFIYKSAGSVLIWVDDKAPDGVDESTRWEAIDPALEAMTILSSVERFLLRPSYNIGPGSDADQPNYDLLIEGARSWTSAVALKQFFRRRYWTRVWTIQEILAGRNLLVCYGGYVVYFQAVIFLFIKMYKGHIPQDTTGIRYYVDDTPVE